MTQEDIKYSGHAFEARIYSENPNKSTAPPLFFALSGTGSFFSPLAFVLFSLFSLL